MFSIFLFLAMGISLLCTTSSVTLEEGSYISPKLHIFYSRIGDANKTEGVAILTTVW